MDEPHYDPIAQTAIVSLAAVIGLASDRLRAVQTLAGKPQTVEEMLADPNSPINIQNTMQQMRSEIVALRNALRPFARSYTKLAEPLDEVEVLVFSDPYKPEKNRYVLLGDFKRAHQAYASPSVVAETAEQLERLERDVKSAGRLLASWLADDGPFTQDDLDESKRLADEYGWAAR